MVNFFIKIYIIFNFKIELQWRNITKNKTKVWRTSHDNEVMNLQS